MPEATERKKRAKGLASRAAILDAAAQIAGERGYEGTSIKLVSERSGLPASSIYWHFKDKDELIAAVIDRSFNAWIEAITAAADVPLGDDPEKGFRLVVGRAGEQLSKFPDFLRLGLMLLLEERPEEPAARLRFHQARTETLALVDAWFQTFFVGLTPEDTQRLAAFTLAGSDGLFVAAIEGDLDLTAEFELLGDAVLGAARGLGWDPAL